MDQDLILARLEERLTLLIEKQHDVQASTDKLGDNIQSLNERLLIIESGKLKDALEAVGLRLNAMTDLGQRVHTLEVAEASNASKWTRIVDLVVKVVGGLIIAYLLLKLGLKP